MESEGSLPYWQEPATGPYSEPNKSNALLHIVPLYDLKTYRRVQGGTSDENNGFYFGWLDLLAPWLRLLLVILIYSAIADLHTFQSTVAHPLGFSVSTSRLLAADLNTESSTSDHYEYSCYFVFNHYGTSELEILLDSLLQFTTD
jgi:hypothetical protein